MNKIDEFLYEHVNVNTNEGREMMTLSEESRVNISDRLVAALYKTAVDKYRELDFGEIPLSKGDITKVKHFNTVQESIKAIEEILKQANTDLPELYIVKDAIKTIIAYRKEFCMGYIQDIEMVQLIYNTIVLAIVSGTTLCINSVVDYIRTPGQDIKTSYDIQSKNNKEYSLLMTNLKKFNDCARKGELNKLFDKLINRNNFIGLAAATTGTAITLVALLAVVSIVPIVRELIYFFYNTRMKVSEFLDAQAAFLEINIAELRNTNISPEVIKKQELRVKKLKGWATKFAIKFNESEKKAKTSLDKKIDAKTATNAVNEEMPFQLI